MYIEPRLTWMLLMVSTILFITIIVGLAYWVKLFQFISHRAFIWNYGNVLRRDPRKYIYTSLGHQTKDCFEFIACLSSASWNERFFPWIYTASTYQVRSRLTFCPHLFSPLARKLHSCIEQSWTGPKISKAPPRMYLFVLSGNSF
jgi:hypothetical protein